MMSLKIGIITIGEELLAGAVLDTNFNYLARRLREEGYSVSRHQTIPDQEGVMLSEIEDAFHKSDLVLITGGLGPTLDDKTKYILAKIFKKKMRIAEDVKEHLLASYGETLPYLEELATVPIDTTILPNIIGTAPGFMFEAKGKLCIAMPGVPQEMISMFELEVIPQIKLFFNKTAKWHVRNITFCHLSESTIDPYLRELDKLYPEVEKGIYPAYGYVNVQCRVKDEYESRALALLDACLDKIESHFPTHLVSKRGDSLALTIHQMMIHKRKTLALAESCTGGHIAAKLVDIAGASQYFLGSVVCYSNTWKTQILGVHSETLKVQGAVSEEAVKEMLSGLMKLSQADYVLAISGVAGPEGGSEAKPVGTVYWGLGVKGEGVYTGKILAKAGAKRATVIEYAANYMLGILWRKLAYDINIF